MPTIELHKNAEDGIWVDALMLFPADDALRSSVFAAMRTSAEIKGAKKHDRIDIEVSTLNLILDAPSWNEIKSLTKEATKQGIVAGDVLASLYLMDRFGVPEPSMNKAIHIASEYAAESKWGDGKRLNVSERMIREAWVEYKSVAHLWAAFRLNQAYPFATKDGLFAESLCDFLAVAAGVLNFAVAFKPFRARGSQPILTRKEAWAPPKDIVPRNLNSKRVPDKILRYLKSYKAPYIGRI